MVNERNMKALNALVICLSFVATGSVTVPTGCSMFGYILNGIGSIHLPHLFPNISGSLSSLIGKRFFIDHPININWTNLFKNSEKVVLDSIKQTLPASKEISHTCRLSLKTTSESNLDFIRAMSKIYTICVICDDFDTNTTSCDKIGFCPSTSVCYRGYSDDRKYWPTSPTYNIFDAMHPKGVFHGCCDPKDAKCLRNRYRVKNINNKVLAAANYTLHRCSSTACNGDDRSAITNFIHKIERVDGNWASWGKWGQCTHNCGTGTRTRHRTCTNPAPASGGKRCTGSSSSSSSCPNLPPCPVDGKWTTWHAWGSCSVTCGDGKQTRTRSCTNPKPAHGGKDCVGNTSDSRQCGQPCIIDGHWSSWGHWGHCQVTCGTGTKSRHRSCTNPAPSNGGKSCAGSSATTTVCSIAVACPVDGHWTLWGHWNNCPVTCGSGTRTRHRSCTNPTPAHGGKTCAGVSSATKQCVNPTSCPVDGHWASWSHWGHCSVTCGLGSKTRHRTCSNPAPSAGGQSCTGSTDSSTQCSDLPSCPVDGKWSTWQAWGTCSVTCGDGKQTRTRTCTNPKPAHGGHACVGDASVSRHCGQPCIVDGHWSSWERWGRCSATCGSGTKTRHRSCTNPAPAHGGKSCSGGSSSTTSCTAPSQCPVDGHWNTWGAWGSCSVTCGDGQATRARSCTNPAPAHGGKTCVGDATVSRNCGQPCIIDGGWSNWQHWSKCSKSCSAGTRSRGRTCSNPSPANGGKDCVGHTSATEACDNGPCPEWTHWFYDACSVTCGSGTTMRVRHCSSGKDSDCGIGKAVETVKCNGGLCPIDGSWGTWKEWSRCSATCGTGQHTRSRSCDDPSPQNGGADCSGPAKETTACTVTDCPHWLPFEATSSCSVTCGKGFMQMKRNCSTGTQSDCDGSAFDEKTCILDECV